MYRVLFTFTQDILCMSPLNVEWLVQKYLPFLLTKAIFDYKGVPRICIGPRGDALLPSSATAQSRRSIVKLFHAVPPSRFST